MPTSRAVHCGRVYLLRQNARPSGKCSESLTAADHTQTADARPRPRPRTSLAAAQATAASSGAASRAACMTFGIGRAEPDAARGRESGARPETSADRPTRPPGGISAPASFLRCWYIDVRLRGWPRFSTARQSSTRIGWLRKGAGMPSRSLAWQASQRDYGAIPLVEPVLRDQRSFRVLVGGNESGLAGALAFQVLIALARGKPFGWCDILGCEAPGIPPGSWSVVLGQHRMTSDGHSC
jgi:hypothetical protein